MKTSSSFYSPSSALRWAAIFIMAVSLLAVPGYAAQAASQPRPEVAVPGNGTFDVGTDSTNEGDDLSGDSQPKENEAGDSTDSGIGVPTLPGNLPIGYVDYDIQSGDTLPSLAARFNTTVTQIMQDNPGLPQGVTILQPGLRLQVPDRDGTLNQPVQYVLADALFVNGPAQVGFDIQEYVKSQPGWLKDYLGFDGTTTISGADIVQTAVRDYHVSPRLLLAMLEYQSGALSNPKPDEDAISYPMGYQNSRHKHLYNQVMVASRLLNEAYYTWRAGEPLSGGKCSQADPRQNAASVAIENVFCQLLSPEEYQQAVGEGKFSAVYARLFGDTGENLASHLPANLRQPELSLPFEPGKVWAFSGGPHTAWGETGQPWAALDFAPPSLVFGCQVSGEWATAVAPGLVVRSEDGLVALDLDKDGDERTGWVIYYLHIADKGRVAAGAVLERGDYVGHPSCEGGRATGSHIHVSRLYNGEWILAYGAMAFDLEGWVVRRGDAAYQGSMVRGREIVYANTNANDKTFIMSDSRITSQISYRPPVVK